MHCRGKSSVCSRVKPARPAVPARAPSARAPSTPVWSLTPDWADSPDGICVACGGLRMSARRLFTSTEMLSNASPLASSLGSGFVCVGVGGYDCLYVYVCVYVCARPIIPKTRTMFQACACAPAPHGLRSAPRAATSAAIASSYHIIQRGLHSAAGARLRGAKWLRSQFRPELRPLLACGTASAELAAACDWGGSLATSDPSVACHLASHTQQTRMC